MYLNTYDMCQLKNDSYSSIQRSINSNIYYVTMLLVYSFGYIKKHNIKTFFKNGISFDFVDINIDHKRKLTYLSESWHNYKDKPTTPEIEKLLEEGNFIKLCEAGFLDHITMKKDNFIHILFAWDKILDQQSPFALLYQDDKDWFDVKPFDTQEAMEQFVADQTQK